LVTVKLYGTLNRYPPGRESTLQLELQEPASAGQLLERLGIPVGMLSALSLNGRRASPEELLSEGDLLEAFPPLCGGHE